MRQLEFRITGLSGGNLRRWKRNKRTSSTSAAPVRAAVWVTAAVAVIYTVYYAGPIRITWPPSGTLTKDSVIEVKGTIQDTRVKKIKLIVNRSLEPEPAQVHDGTFSAPVLLVRGDNTIQAASDAVGSTLTDASNFITVSSLPAAQDPFGEAIRRTIFAIKEAHCKQKWEETYEELSKVAAEMHRKEPTEATKVADIKFTAVGESTAAEIKPLIPGVIVQYTVTGTDGYCASGLDPTDTSGNVAFRIPPADSGVVDTVSVSAVSGGKSTTTKFTWCPGKVPCR